MKQRTAKTKKALTEERRKLYKAEDWEAYKTLVNESIQKDEQEAMSFVKEVTEAIGITEQEFGMTHQQLSMDQ